MSIPKDKALYAVAKKIADEKYGKKTSAYKSGFIVQQYKKMGGEYENITNNKMPPLKRWFAEQWKNIDPNATKTSYPVYRPTKIIDTKKTPLTVAEIDKQNLKKRIREKQLIKGTQNLKPFKKKKDI